MDLPRGDPVRRKLPIVQSLVSRQLPVHDERTAEWARDTQPHATADKPGHSAAGGIIAIGTVRVVDVSHGIIRHGRRRGLPRVLPLFLWGQGQLRGVPTNDAVAGVLQGMRLGLQGPVRLQWQPAHEPAAADSQSSDFPVQWPMVS